MGRQLGSQSYSAAGRVAAGAWNTHSASWSTSRPVRAHQASIVAAHHNGRPSASVRSGRGSPDAGRQLLLAAGHEQSRPTLGAASLLRRRSTLYLAAGLAVFLVVGAGVLGAILRGTPDGGQLSAAPTAAPAVPTPPIGDFSTEQEAGAGMTTTAAPATGPTSWAAVVGPPYQEQELADVTLAQVQASVPTGRIVPVTQLPQTGLLYGLVIIVPGFSTREQAEQFCTAAPPGLPPGCQPVAMMPG